MKVVFKIVVLLMTCCCFFIGCVPVDRQTKTGDSDEPTMDKLVPPAKTDVDWSKPISPEKLKEDLDFLFKTIEEVHPNMYAYISEEEFAKHRDQLYRQIDRPMTRLEFYKLAAPVVSLLKNGHTWLIFPQEEYRAKGGKLFPLMCEWDGKKLIAHENKGQVEVPLGGMILTINGMNAVKLIHKFSRNKPTERKNNDPYHAAAALRVWLWLYYGPVESYKVTIKDTAGNIDSYVLPSITRDKLVSQKQNEVREKNNFIYSYLPEHDAGMIECRLFWGMSESKKSFETIFAKIKEQMVKNLIIDVRRNPGGHSDIGDALLCYLTDQPFRPFDLIQVKLSRQGPYLEAYRQYFPDKEWKIGSVVDYEVPNYEPQDNPLRFNGRIFLLIGSKTASSATSFAAAFKSYSIGTVIGEETLEKLTSYGEIYFFRLPHTDLLGQVSQKYFVEAGGKPDGRSVLPDYEIKQKPEDTAKGVDTVLQFTLDLIKEKQ